jgi:hypothetical protein
MDYLKTGPAQGPDQEVVDHIGPEVSDMGVIVNRRSAAVKPDFFRINRLEDL